MPTTYSKKPITSIGLKIGIAIETTAGTKPTTDYYALPGITDIPDLDFEPDTIETTSYDNLEFKSYLPGLRDTGGIVSLEANFSDYGVQLWNTIVEQLDPSTNTTGLIAWLFISIKGTTTKFFVPIEPAKTGVPSAPVNDVVSINYNFTVAGDITTDSINSTAEEAYWASGDYPFA